MPTAEEALAAIRYAQARAAEAAAARAAKRRRSSDFYASVPWKRLRYQALAENAKRNGGVAQCELCHTPAAPGKPLNVDHIQPLSKNWARRLDRTNVQVMCEKCNMGKSNTDSIDWRKAAERARGAAGT